MADINIIRNYVLLTLDEPQFDGTIVEDTKANREVIDAFIERVNHGVVYGEYDAQHSPEALDPRDDPVVVSYHNAKMDFPTPKMP